MIEADFEWDADKADANLAKHGVAFEAATKVFLDAFALEACDTNSNPLEIRFIVTGLVNGLLLTVVYTERGERLRIISARK